MITHSRQPGRTPGRAISRRHAVIGLVSIAASAAIAVKSVGTRPASASGLVSGAALTELATYRGWRGTWDLVVPILVQGAFPRTFLLYDRAAGEASLLAVDQFGSVGEVRAFSGWRASWDNIVSSPFPGMEGVRGLIAYDSAAGQVGVFELDLFGNLRELRTHSNWRRTWSAFVPFGTDGLLTYDRAAGYATVFRIDVNGSFRELQSFNNWRRSWDILTSGAFTSAQLPGRDVLLYDRAAQQAAGLTVALSGEVSPFADYSGWRSTWTSISGGTFSLRGSSTTAVADLFLFDQQAQEIEFLEIGSGSSLSSLLRTSTPGSNTWSAAIPLGPDLLFFYERAAGMAAFYVTNRAPVVTPTPIPPTPTPTPTPPAPTGRITVRLEQGRGNDRDKYSGKSATPAGIGRKRAIITAVKNTAAKRISLIHVDRAGTRRGPVFIKADEVSTAFNGMRADGEWEARVSGSLDDAPPRVTLEIRYEAR